MKTSELIQYLTQSLKEHGDLPCVVTESHEYWGSLYTKINEYNITVMNAQPDGPKSGKS